MQGAGSSSELEIRRNKLLERLDRVRPKIVALIAPAGFGKTTLARQYLAGDEAWAVCDCSGVRDDLDLARRLIFALAAEHPEREQYLTQHELMMGDGGSSIVDRINIALQVWREPRHGTLVFENSEHLANSGAARDFFVRLLATRPEGRSIVICSREALRIHLTRFAAPHEIMVLRAGDLAFEESCVRNIFTKLLVDAPSIERITTVSQGWPIAVLLLKRFAAEGRIATLLDRLDDVAFEELHDYLADEVLASLDPRLVEAIFACACIPHATAADLRGALADGGSIDDLAKFGKESPFITRGSGGVFTVHPLLASLLLEHQEARRSRLLQRVAAYHESARRFARAAELHLARGDQAAAAHALGQHEVVRDPNPSMPYAMLLSQLDRALVHRYPRLWGVTALLRMFCVDTESLLDEANSIWRTLSPEVSPLERYYIFLFRIVFMGHLGLFEEALAMVDVFAREAREAKAPRALNEGYIPFLHALLCARMGRLQEAERELTRVLPTIEHLDVMASGTLLALGADIARVRGERALERRFIERATERARSSGLSNVVAFDVAEALFGAWFAGEDALVSRYGVELESYVERCGVRGFGYLAAVACGREGEPSEIDNPKYVVFGHLLATSRALDERVARRFARSAFTLAEQSQSPFAQVMAAIAVALTDATAKSEYLEIARRAALACESPELHASIDALLQGRSSGMLSAFVERFAREPRTLVPPLEIEIVPGLVRVDGALVSLPGRELELLVALGLRPEAVPRARLAAMLWPDQEEYAARNALSVALHRLRAHLGREDAVVRDGDGYRLHIDARVDLWEMERTAGILRGHTTLRDADRDVLERLATRLAGHRPDRMLRWEWFEPTERRLREVRIEVAHRLAIDALDRADPERALLYAREMIAHDPCDEPAREIAIRSYLALGDRAAALRQYRQYRQMLMKELACEPSTALSALVS